MIPIIVIFILVVGLLRNGWDVYNNRKDIKLLFAFQQKLVELNEHIDGGQTFINEIAWIRYHERMIKDIIDENESLNFFMLLSDLSNGSTRISNDIYLLSCDIIGWMADVNRKGKSLLLMFLNPFIWFYKGIESLMEYTVGYLVKMINPTIDFRTGWWKGLNIVISFVGGIASVISLFYTK